MLVQVREGNRLLKKSTLDFQVENMVIQLN